MEYRASPTAEENKPPSQYVISNVKTIVEQQQYFFDMLWAKSIPANQRMIEIEKGLERQFIKTIDDPIQIQKVFLEITSSASFEILIVFATFNEFFNQIKNGIGELFSRLSVSKRIIIKILIPYPPPSQSYENYGLTDNSNIEEKIKCIFKQNNSQQQQQHKIELRYLEQPLQTKVTILIVDRKYSLVIETNKEKIKDLPLGKTKQGEEEEDINNNAEYFKSEGLSIFSNSESTVSSLSSIFEILWRQIDLYEELREVHKELEIRDEAQKEFISIAAHELRNPIQPILGISEILHSKSEISKNNEYLKVIFRNAKKLKQLSEDLLDVAKIESHSLQLHKEYFNLNEILLNAIADLNNKNIKEFENSLKLESVLILVSKEEDVFINADKSRIIQVVFNLLNNAIKFTVIDKIEEEERKGHITITVDKKGNDHIVVSIKDTGKGIDSEILPRLFTKFVPKSKMGGTGLGLFISKSIVEAHGGRIWAENNDDGKGATFGFSLPFVVDQ